ncbi:MAG TPA: type II secretion system minor pseudopilin GspK [Aquimonas sp.]|nr:type II secretion system minor pseudopilin GspK [Aquimonas sp.]HRF53562.1 type II secretion system minor pseudopilin GspK [Aquimonas sp.]
MSALMMSKQKGVALLVALLVVALASVLMMAGIDQAETATARTRNALRAEQAWQMQQALEAWAGEVLLQDVLANGEVDSASDTWATPMSPTEIPNGRVQGRLRELGGCLNVNSLLRNDADDEVQQKRMQRLLQTLGLPPALLPQMLDWMDRDPQPRPGGVEDIGLQAMTPARRSANRLLMHASELRQLPSMTADHWRKLSPFLCALPPETGMNLNMAAPELWMTLADGMSFQQARQLARDGQANYSNLDAVMQELERLRIGPVASQGLDVGSHYFVAESAILLDGIPFRYSSLLAREQGGVRVLARVRGAW